VSHGREQVHERKREGRERWEGTGEIWSCFTVCVSSSLFERFRAAHASLLTHISLSVSRLLSLPLSVCVHASLIIHNPQHPHALFGVPGRRERDRDFHGLARRDAKSTPVKNRPLGGEGGVGGKQSGVPQSTKNARPPPPRTRAQNPDEPRRAVANAETRRGLISARGLSSREMSARRRRGSPPNPRSRQSS